MTGDLVDAQGITWDQFITELFAEEYCAECGGDSQHHEPAIFMGNWFAHCIQPIAAGAIVLTQHGGQEHTGLVLRDNRLADFVLVDWEHIGEWPEYIDDVTVVGYGFR